MLGPATATGQRSAESQLFLQQSKQEVRTMGRMDGEG